eukprot:COSAG02_NODE_60040_length_272_cov_0.895954_1_plen_54_part_01
MNQLQRFGIRCNGRAKQFLDRTVLQPPPSDTLVWDLTAAVGTADPGVRDYTLFV